MAETANGKGSRFEPQPLLNLATSPSGGYRAFCALACTAAIALLAVAGQLAVQYLGSGELPEELVAQERQLLDEQRTQTRLGMEASAKIEGPETISILERNAFLNELLVRKGVSWTQTFLDLAQVLPPSVRMLTIRPEVAYGDTILLDMTVSAKQEADFIEFLKELEGSELFGSLALRGSVPPDEREPDFRYQLEVEYGQRL